MFNAINATPDEPFLSLSLYLPLITGLSLSMARESPPADQPCEGVAVADADPDRLEAALRLVAVRPARWISSCWLSFR